MHYKNSRALLVWMWLGIAVEAGLAQGLAPARPQEVALSPERLERLTDAFRGYVENGKLAGAVVLVARRGKVAYLKPFGWSDKESRASMREDGIFRIASQTKPIISAAVMMLQEQGALLISDPVGKYLPEFRKTTVAVPKDGNGYEVVQAKRPITIRDLLTHTAGIGYGSGTGKERWAEAKIQGWYFADRDEPIGATVSRIASLPFEGQPGERWVYGYATDILGALIERISGVSLEEFLRTRIFQPLGMVDTHFYLPAAKRDRLAAVYSSNESGALGRAPDPGGMVGQGAYMNGPRKSHSGGAGLLSTAMDYARFLQMILNGGTLDGTHILSRKTVELMTTNHIGSLFPTPGVGFGLGFSVVTDLGARGQLGSVGEFGWGGAYHSAFWVDPREELVVVYFTQLIPAGEVDDHGKLRALVYQAIADGKPREQPHETSRSARPGL